MFRGKLDGSVTDTGKKKRKMNRKRGDLLVD